MYIHGHNSGLNTREVKIYDSYAFYEGGWWGAYFSITDYTVHS
jgi:hypothetical protein